MVVDESEAGRTQVGEALRAAGFQAVEIGYPEAALPLWSLFRPRVVLMAAHAPAFSSVAIAPRLQAQSQGAVPFVYLLDAPDPDLRLHVLERGLGLDALAKPLDPREVVARVRSLLRFREGVRRTMRPEDDETAGLRDRLTGIWSRRALTAFVGQELLRCARRGGGFGVLGVELLGFRQFRRAFGRSLADRLVLYASTVLLQSSRESDVVGAWRTIGSRCSSRPRPARGSPGCARAWQTSSSGPASRWMGASSGPPCRWDAWHSPTCRETQSGSWASPSTA
jgi:PleD family two-component response regulator